MNAKVRTLRFTVRTLFVAHSLLGMSGCGSHSSGPGAAGSPVPAVVTLAAPLDPAFVALNLPPLVCADDRAVVPSLSQIGTGGSATVGPHANVSAPSCPAAIGQIITKTYRGLHLCTGTLVAPNVVLTASHCLPWESITHQEMVGGGCWFRTMNAVARCVRVIQASRGSLNDETQVQSDYAYIQIAPGMSEPPARVVDEWNSQDEGATAIWVTRVNAGDDSARVDGGAVESTEIRRLRCRREDTAELRGRSWIPSRTRVFSHCLVHPGDSGGPLVDDAGQIHGVISLRLAARDNPRPIYTVIARPEPLSCPVPR